ncbi:MAG: hypothetical protein D6723_02715 [Acidobacteria bacterium]|nr:MAG: hypothetical protein D6723_02715 [Acidobacteriota bacterium]
MTFEELVKKLQEIEPDEDDMDLIEYEARSLLDEFGPHDAELFVEWMERANRLDNREQRSKLAQNLISRAETNHFKEILLSFFEDNIIT